MGLAVLVNARAGSGPRPRDLTAALRSAGVGATVETIGSGADLRSRAARRASDGEALVAAGGDGTVSTLAGVAAEHGVPLGVLPYGTLNHFARDAGIPGDRDRAIAALRDAPQRFVDVGDLNGRVFINNASLGIYPRMVWERSAARRRGHRKWVAAAVALARVWRRYRTLTVRLRIDGREHRRRTPFVFVGNGRYQSEGLQLGARPALDSGVLSIFVAPYCGRFELLRVAVRALAGQLDAEPKFESFEARAVTLQTDRRRVSVALDGEVTMMSSPLTFRIRPSALRLLGSSVEAAPDVGSHPP